MLFFNQSCGVVQRFAASALGAWLLLVVCLLMAGCKTMSPPAYMTHDTVSTNSKESAPPLFQEPPKAANRVAQHQDAELTKAVFIREEIDGMSASGLCQPLRLPTQCISHRPTLGNDLVNDHLNFYSQQSFVRMTGGVALGALFANTNLDRSLHGQFQRDFRGDDVDETYEFLHANKEWGNGYYTLPIFASAWVASQLFDESPAADWSGEWGERSLRSFLVGAPPMLLAQRVTGASRPSESRHDSRWRPFQDGNGVSGHSFMGALPFINAARMTENPWLKASLYAGSALAPLSRVNDDAHYPSQAALGWWFAYLAAASVNETQDADQLWQFRPLLESGNTGGAIEFQF